MSEELAMRLSKLKWKVEIKNGGYANGDYYWTATTEDDAIKIRTKAVLAKKNVRTHFEEFAKDNRIKYYIYI